MKQREHFASKFGIIAAAAGSAIGLGNIWKFPYITGKNGGAAFILVYIGCILLIGLPIMITEFVLGRRTQSNAVETYRQLKPNQPWHLNGVLSVSTAFIILSFYAMIAGWVFSYVGQFITGSITQVAPSQLGDYFGQMISKPIAPILWTFAVLFVTVLVVLFGVKKGVEKACKILMPILVGILIILMIRSVTLPGGFKGLEFLFKPDFSQLSTKGVLEALGHAFYSLSLGMGIIITYGSYFDKKVNIPAIALQVTIADTVIALMAGIVIFPAVFAYGFEPNSGPALIFVTLPAVFEAMPFGQFFGFLFFLLIAIAAITSTISLLEVVVAYVIEKWEWSRKKATLVVASLIFLLSIPSTLSFSTMSNVMIFGKTFFDALDFLASNIFLPLAGFFVCIFVGWVWGTKNTITELQVGGTLKIWQEKLYSIIIKTIAPIAILIILLYSTGIIKM